MPPAGKKKDQSKPLDKLFIYISIVSSGQGSAVINLLNYVGCTAQFLQKAKGTAPNSIMEILNIINNDKDVIVSFIKESLLDDAEKELNAFFNASKKNRGVAFAIPLAAITGKRMYSFLTKTIN